ncbi:MAG: sugar phosphate isomerase/epimerase family protein [Bryobacteraceae bacterium]
MNRRQFLGAAAATALTRTAAQAQRPAVRFGVDLFSIRSQGWDAFQQLDYCAKLGARVVHFSEIRFIGSLEEAHLTKVRAHAEKLGVEIELGMRSICPTSSAFDKSQGTAEEQLTKMTEAARIVGSPIVRAFLGTSADRTGPVPLEQHIENTARVLRNCRSRIVDAGLKVAVENHAGDLQAWELKNLIEAAGRDFVGACLDSGNPLWTLEDPHVSLETLAPYVVTSHLRDSYVWRTPDGVAVRWVRFGEGNVGIREWVRKFIELCPGKTLSHEVIVAQARTYRIFDPKFWAPYQHVRAHEFVRFLALAEAGKPLPDLPKLPREAALQKEREDLEVSIENFRALLKEPG